jgi:hypothetical protein
MQFRTLADVRALIERHLPAHCRDKAIWRVVAKDLKAAALAPILRRFRSRCAWRFQWKASDARRSDAPPLPAALVGR